MTKIEKLKMSSLAVVLLLASYGAYDIHRNLDIDVTWGEQQPQQIASVKTPPAYPEDKMQIASNKVTVDDNIDVNEAWWEAKRKEWNKALPPVEYRNKK